MSKLQELFKDKFNMANAKHKKPPTHYDDFKPIVIPDGFAVAIDTREQLPLFTKARQQFSKNEKRIENDLILVGTTLHNGDYSVCGLEKLVAIERKQQSDFESYITSEYSKKTKKKLEQLRKYYFKALVIEANENDLYEYPISDYVTREMVKSHILSFRVHYGMQVIINEDRKILERIMLDWFVKCYKYLVIDNIRGIQKELKGIMANG